MPYMWRQVYAVGDVARWALFPLLGDDTRWSVQHRWFLYKLLNTVVVTSYMLFLRLALSHAADALLRRSPTRRWLQGVQACSRRLHQQLRVHACKGSRGLVLPLPSAASLQGKGRNVFGSKRGALLTALLTLGVVTLAFLNRLEGKGASIAEGGGGGGAVLTKNRTGVDFRA